MSRADWSSLVALRNRRADEALLAAQHANARRVEAGCACDVAAAAFDRDEGDRAARRKAVYASMAGRSLSVSETLRLMDTVQGIARESAMHRAQVQRLADQHRQAVQAAERASEVHQDKRRAAEKSDAVLRRLAKESDRRHEILLETELEEIATTLRAFSGRKGSHAG